MSARRMAGLPNGHHYTIWRIDAIEDVHAVFNDHTDYTLNWLFVGTSGVHGSYASLDDVAASLDAPADQEDGPRDVTVLIVQPRLVKTSYGTFPLDRADIAYLRDCVRKTLVGIARSQEGSV